MPAPSRRMRRIRRIALGLAVLLAAAAAVGALYEQGARRRARRDFPPPGRLVDVGGRRIQIDCRGAGSPTVVLESGLDLNGSLSWAEVHDSLAGITRTCAYSRAGILWSDPAPGAFDSRRAAADLHAALRGSGERPPWVLAGHSLGGPYAMTFTARYPQETAGMVFVDASHPDARAATRRVQRNAPSRFRRARNAAVLLAAPTLARLGIARVMPRRRMRPPEEWPPRMQAAHTAFFPTSAAAMSKEIRALDETLDTAGRLRTLGDRPLVVLTASWTGVPDGQVARQSPWEQLQADQARWSTRSRRETVNAGHYIHWDRPDVVIRAVREVVTAVRAGGTGPR